MGLKEISAEDLEWLKKRMGYMPKAIGVRFTDDQVVKLAVQFAEHLKLNREVSEKAS